jgi:hypothetical protein
MKESNDNMKFLLTMIQYEKYLWYVCGDLKVIALLLGLQLGYTKVCCFYVSGIVGTENPFCQKTVAKEEKSHTWEEKCYL